MGGKHYTIIFPTHVGVNRIERLSIDINKDFPHACGGEPHVARIQGMTIEFSPRMWG